jgi:hypothetical protein
VTAGAVSNLLSFFKKLIELILDYDIDLDIFTVKIEAR